MSRAAHGPRGERDGDPTRGLSGAVLFSRLWDSLSGLIGTAATAALLTRAARRAMPRQPDLRELSIERVDGEFHFVVPGSFDRASGPSAALRELAIELGPLLAEATGEVALRHLARVPELRGWAVAAGPS